MCGIAGVATMTNADIAGPMRAMREALAHRGPDAAGEYVDDRVALGVRRLRIVDLLTGDQPQANEDRTVWTVFNGEIYNFIELRDELARRGHRFATTRSDTEVIVHLYEEMGARLVERLEGMFALAVWDAAEQTLVLARDRLGKKPLLYAEEGDRITFASEHVALLEGLRRLPEVDLSAIARYLRLGYVPAPYDAFRGVRKLPPAHTLVWRGGQTRIDRYWSPPRPGTLAISEDEAVAELRRLLDRAVAKRLVADVPIGAFLSGGVDSSGVVATMARATSRVRTFSIGFEDPEWSELAHARRIADRYGTEHHEMIVRPEGLDVIPTLVRHYGEPYADSSAIPTYYLSKLTRQHVTVALNGDGGDELFGGYERYSAVRLASWMDLFPAFIRVPMIIAASNVLPDSADPRSRSRRIKRFLRASTLRSHERYLRWLGVFDGDHARALFRSDLAAEVAATPSWVGNGEWEEDPVAAAQSLDLRSYLPDDLLVKVDIASMANSLEVRCPLLDRELVEFAVALPTALKIRGLDRKYVLKRALADRVPPENMYRRKQGFGVPIGAWFRGDLRALMTDVILSDRALERGLVHPEVLAAMVREHTSGSADHTHRLWALLMLELWHREFVDRDPRRGSSAREPARAQHELVARPRATSA